MASPNRLHHLLYKGPKILADPGTGKVIRVTADLQICEMVVGASAETRTLANPTKPGIRFVLRLKTDGGGDLVVTAANGLNASLNTTATFSEVDDFLSLISVTTVANTTYRWDILEGNVDTGMTSSSATISASITATSTASATRTSTSTSTATPTSTQTSTTTASETSTATSTASASASAGTSTPSASSTGTSTATQTASVTATTSSTATATASKTGTSTSTKTSSGTSTGTSSPTSTGSA